MCGLQTSSAITGQGRGDLRVERRGLLGLDEKAEFPTLPWPSHWLQNAGRSSWRVSGMEEGEDLFQRPGALVRFSASHYTLQEDPETGDGCPPHLRPESGVKQAESH